MENLTLRWTQSRPFSPKIGCFFRFSKMGKEGLPNFPPSPSYVRVSVAEYGSVSLNVLKYP